MRQYRLTPLAFALLLLLIPATTLAGGNDEQPVAFDAQAAFEAIKSLEGEWVGTVKVEGAEESRETTVVYKVSANGHSVIETFAPGKPLEMFSVYHMDGDDLLMTHYCAIGNAPKMKFRETGKPGELAFEFNGGTNLDPEKDAHAHEGKRQLHGPNHYTSVSIGFNDGKPTAKRHFSMNRVQ